MKFIIIGILLLFVTPCFAETYIIFNSDTQEVLSVSPQDDAVMPQTGYTKIIIKDNFWDLDLQYPHQWYKWSGSRLIPNTKKLDEEAIKEEKVREKVEQEKLINDELRSVAIERLKAKGINIKEE